MKSLRHVKIGFPQLQLGENDFKDFVEWHFGKVTERSELALLGRVFNRLRFDGQSEQQRETLASRIIANYMAGVVDEEELLSALKQALGR
ncbi:hypothetical protein [Mesorhizobium sp. WSM2561]|uniref:hypothetical protein n=1 Tax=Mesorhizobium sp. WSM2561 TaxID=1040985 RepID=UPI0004AD7BDE|nr:hypothetical protein [Mesorhizobium sp. WSM2561]